MKEGSTIYSTVLYVPTTFERPRRDKHLTSLRSTAESVFANALNEAAAYNITRHSWDPVQFSGMELFKNGVDSGSFRSIITGKNALVELAIEVNSAYVAVTVKDEGEGLTTEREAAIRDILTLPYEDIVPTSDKLARAQRSGTPVLGGRGQGLWKTREYVDTYNGALLFTNLGLGVGAEFSVRFPFETLRALNR